MITVEELQLKEDEILIDGIIFCRDCRTPRMFKSDDGEFCARALCRCQAEAEKHRIEKLKLENHFEEAKRLKIISILGEKYINSSFDSLDMDVDISFVRASERCRNFCANWENIKKVGAGLYLFSHIPGNGKTELTACITNTLTEQLVPVLMTNMLEISKLLRQAYYSNATSELEIIEKLVSVDLLFIDDLGVEKLFKNGEDTFLQDRLYDIINRRYNAKKSTGFTSNYSITELVEERGLWFRTADRIREMSHAVIELKGPSYRPKMRKREAVLF